MNQEHKMIEMPRYVCHKTVHALEIFSVHVLDDSYRLEFVDSKYAGIIISEDLFEKHNFEAGGYYVVYKDGYKSFSPKKAFEDGYTKEEK